MGLATSEINQLVTYTEQAKASSSDTLTGAAKQITSSDFLNLMMKQLQYQDPLSPTDNSQFIAQECQFAQLDATQKMNDTISDSTTVSQALSLVGKSVIMTNPNDSTKAFTGTVDAVYVNGSDTCLNIGGKNYSMSYLQYVYEPASTSSSSSSTTNSSSSGSSSTSSNSSSSSGSSSTSKS